MEYIFIYTYVYDIYVMLTSDMSSVPTMAFFYKKVFKTNKLLTLFFSFSNRQPDGC